MILEGIVAWKDDTGGKWQGKMILEGIVAGKDDTGGKWQGKMILEGSGRER